MPLNQVRLKNKIKAAFQAEQSEQSDYNASLDRISDKISQAVIEEIKELKIMYSTGLTTPSGGGPVTGTLTHTIE